jgi:hypothetical protein
MYKKVTPESEETQKFLLCMYAEFRSYRTGGYLENCIQIW